MVAKQNPSLKYMEPAQMKDYEDLLLAYRIASGQLLADGPGLCGGDVAGSGEARGMGWWWRPVVDGMGVKKGLSGQPLFTP